MFQARHKANMYVETFEFATSVCACSNAGYLGRVTLTSAHIHPTPKC